MVLKYSVLLAIVYLSGTDNTHYYKISCQVQMKLIISSCIICHSKQSFAGYNRK